MYGEYAADVAWHSKHSYLFASSGGRILRMFDLRSPAPIASRSGMAHRSEINCVSFNPFNESLVASGSHDTTVMLFDMRSLDHPIHTFNYHSEEVLQIGWSPHNGNILASSCDDRRIMVWDTARIGMRQSAKDAEDGPAELLFIHGGHTDIVPDFSWNPTEEWLIASVSYDNMLQVWQMGDHVYND